MLAGHPDRGNCPTAGQKVNATCVTTHKSFAKARDLIVTRPESSGRSGSLSIQVEVQIFLVLPCHLVRTQVSLRELGSLRSGVRPEGSGRVVESGPTDSGTLWVRQFAVRAYITLSPAFEVRTENMCIVRRTVTSPGTEVRDAVRMNTITS